MIDGQVDGWVDKIKADESVLWGWPGHCTGVSTLGGPWQLESGRMGSLPCRKMSTDNQKCPLEGEPLPH